MNRLFALFIFVILVAFAASAQQMPSDSVLLKIIFGSVNANGKSSTRTPEDYGNVKFAIAFKGVVRIDGQNILLVVCRAPAFSQFGHQFGFTSTYYLHNVSNQWKKIKSFEETDPSPIGDNHEMQVVAIGKNKKALITTFQSTGNEHFERNITLQLITAEGLTAIGTIALDYSNETWTDSDDNEPCKTESHSSTFIMNDTNNEWFPIQVTKTVKLFNNVCEEAGVKDELLTYQYNGHHYQRIK